MFFKEQYTKNIIPQVQETLKIKNPMEVPRLEKIVLNMGIGSYIASGNKDFSNLKNDLALISGQIPMVVNSKKAISNFKLKAGMPVGMTVTLR
jgi:large subunit ribosomal protein L5